MEVNMKIPRPADMYEYKLYTASRISIQRMKDDGRIPNPEEYSWNIYFWNVFKHRMLNKHIDCSRYIIKISKI